jgi:hypothetical protein
MRPAWGICYAINNLPVGCERVMEIDNSDVTILSDGFIDRLTIA